MHDLVATGPAESEPVCIDEVPIEVGVSRHAKRRRERKAARAAIVANEAA